MKSTLAILIVIGVVAAGSGCKRMRAESEEEQCIRQMWMLWDMVRSYTTQCATFEECVDPYQLTNYVRGGIVPTCPLGQEKYPPFSLLDGPRCPHGHALPEDERREMQRFWQLSLLGAKDKQELIAALRSPSGLIRMGGLYAVTQVLADDDVIAEIGRLADSSDDACYWACGWYYDKPLNEAAQDTLARLQAGTDTYGGWEQKHRTKAATRPGESAPGE